MPTARHLDAVTDGYRSTYWLPPTSQDVPPRSPTQREALRVDIATREVTAHGPDATMRLTDSLKSPNTRTRSIIRKRHDPANYAKDRTTQDWLATVGQTRSLPTNVTDPPHTLNTNMLRSERKHDYVDPLPEGGHLYNIKVNSDNFVEERFDKKYQSGVHTQLVRPNPRYMSEYTDRMNEALPSWRAAKTAAQQVAPQPPKSEDYRSTLKETPDYIYYAREGFGPITTNGDATLPAKQGSPWVGTAPQKQYESVNKTQMSKGRFEFQKRFVGDNIRNKVCQTFRPGAKPADDHLERWTVNLSQGERYASTWKTTAQADFVNFSGHRGAPNLGQISAARAAEEYRQQQASLPRKPKHMPNVWKIN